MDGILSPCVEFPASGPITTACATQKDRVRLSSDQEPVRAEKEPNL